MSCRVGEIEEEPVDFVWTREGVRFTNSDNYNVAGSNISLANVTRADAGFYYCSAIDPETGKNSDHIFSARSRMLLTKSANIQTSTNAFRVPLYKCNKKRMSIYIGNVDISTIIYDHHDFIYDVYFIDASESVCRLL